MIVEREEMRSLVFVPERCFIWFNLVINTTTKTNHCAWIDAMAQIHARELLHTL